MKVRESLYVIGLAVAGFHHSYFGNRGCFPFVPSSLTNGGGARICLHFGVIVIRVHPLWFGGPAVPNSARHRVVRIAATIRVSILFSLDRESPKTKATDYRSPQMAASRQPFQWCLRRVLAGRRPAPRPALRHHTSVCSAISSASSTSIPRYRTVLSSLEWPSSNCTARRFLVRLYISVAFVRRSVCVP